MEPFKITGTEPHLDELSRWVAQGGTEECYYEHFGFLEEYDVPEPREFEEDWKRLKKSGKSPWCQFMAKDEDHAQDPVDSHLMPVVKKN
jgi:hypothetical protein